MLLTGAWNVTSADVTMQSETSFGTGDGEHLPTKGVSVRINFLLRCVGEETEPSFAVEGDFRAIG